MPFFLIPSALGLSFFLIWAFIGGMIFRDSQLAAQHETDSDLAILPRSASRIPNRPHSKSNAQSPWQPGRAICVLICNRTRQPPARIRRHTRPAVN